MRRRTPTVFGLQPPRGDRAYRLWYAAYRTARVLRHLVGLHDWRLWGPSQHLLHCDWCGATKTWRDTDHRIDTLHLL